MHKQFDNLPLIFICFFFYAANLYAQNDILSPINSAFSTYETGQYKTALRATSMLPDTVISESSLIKIKLAILKYYDHRLNNRHRKAITTIQDLDDLHIPPETPTHIQQEFVGLRSTVAIEINNPKKIKNYQSYWNEQQELTPIESIQKIRIAWYYAHQDPNYTGRKDLLEKIYQTLIHSGLQGHPEMGIVLRDLGILSRQLSDFDRAIEYFQAEKHFCITTYDSMQIGVGISDYNLGSIYYETLEFQKSLDHFLDARRIFNRHQLSNRRLRYVNEAIGDMNFELGHLDEAAKYWALASNYQKSKNLDLLDKKTHIADSFLQRNAVAAAIEVYEDALNFREKQYGSTHTLTAECHAYIGRAYAKKNAFYDSAEKYHQALQIFLPNFYPKSVLDSPDSISTHKVNRYLFESLVGKSEALYQLYLKDQSQSKYLFAAYDHIQLAHEALKLVRHGPLSDGSQIRWSHIARAFIEVGLKISYQLQQSNTSAAGVVLAYELLESSRSFLLRKALQAAKAFEVSGVPKDVVHQEQKMRAELTSYAAKIQREEKRCTEANNDYIRTWKTHFAKLRVEHDNYLRHIELTYPEYYSLKFNETTHSVNKIQSILTTRRELCLSYFQGTDFLFILGTRSDSIQLYQIDYSIEVASTIDSLYKNINDPSYFLNYPTLAKHNFRRFANKLYSILIEPVSLFDQNVQQLNIIADLDLHNIPFEILLISNTTNSSYKTMDYLIHHTDISYASSLSLLYEGINSSQSKFKKQYCGFSPSYTEAAEFSSRTYGELVFNHKEIEKGMRHFSGTHFQGDKATKRTFIESSQNAQVLHVAAHAILENEQPLLSHIVFSPSSPDSVLQAYEIYNQSIAADLTILSACNSGVGKIYPGEGSMSLSRAFQYAGCPSLIMTLWSVDDEASSYVIEYFIEFLSDGHSRQKSISKAKRAYLKKADQASAHPFYWAGYVLVGNPGPIETDSFNYYFLGILVLALFLTWWICRRYFWK